MSRIDSQMYAGFNKHGNTVRVGNWVEERALQERTGYHRYERWYEEGDPDGKRITQMQNASGGTDRRVIYHQDTREPFIPASAFPDPKTNQEFITPSDTSLRTRMRQSQLQATAKTLMEKPSVDMPTGRTTSQDTYVKAPAGFITTSFNAESRGKGGGSSKIDMTYGEVAERASQRLPAADASGYYGSERAVTFYTENLKSMHGVSATNNPANPFCRNTGFTNDILSNVRGNAEAIDNAGLGKTTKDFKFNDVKGDDLEPLFSTASRNDA